MERLLLANHSGSFLQQSCIRWITPFGGDPSNAGMGEYKLSYVQGLHLGCINYTSY